ncbi:UNVERIFIED_CONTAM: hypothetical protein FKN15_048488 [Acipenser sinensis]
MEQVLMEVGKVIGSYPFKFQGARILSGVEEGAYGWIAINYLLSSFIKYSYEGKRLHPKNRKILGALNVGDASTQITFTPEGRIADKQTEASFRLYGYIRTQENCDRAVVERRVGGDVMDQKQKPKHGMALVKLQRYGAPCIY